MRTFNLTREVKQVIAGTLYIYIFIAVLTIASVLF